MSAASLLVALHVAADLVWIGSILAVAVVLGANEGDMQTRGALALGVYRRLAVPAFLVAFVTGVGRLAMDVHGYFVATHFMHAKLLLAIAVIGLHHVLGARARRVASGQRADAGAVAGIALGLLIAAAGAASFAILKPF